MGHRRKESVKAFSYQCFLKVGFAGGQCEMEKQKDLLQMELIMVKGKLSMHESGLVEMNKEREKQEEEWRLKVRRVNNSENYNCV